MKVHVITNLYRNSIEYLLTKVSIDNRAALHELSEITNIQNLIGDKGYIGKIREELKKKKELIYMH